MWLSCRGRASTSPSVPNRSPATCPRTGTPSSTASGTSWCLHPLSTPSWPWSPWTPSCWWWRWEGGGWEVLGQAEPRQLSPRRALVCVPETQKTLQLTSLLPPYLLFHRGISLWSCLHQQPSLWVFGAECSEIHSSSPGTLKAKVGDGNQTQTRVEMSGDVDDHGVLKECWKRFLILNGKVINSRKCFCPSHLQL